MTCQHCWKKSMGDETMFAFADINQKKQHTTTWRSRIRIDTDVWAINTPDNLLKVFSDCEKIRVFRLNSTLLLLDLIRMFFDAGGGRARAAKLNVLSS